MRHVNVLLMASLSHKNEHGDPYFLLHFCNIENIINNWSEFQKNLNIRSISMESP